MTTARQQFIKIVNPLHPRGLVITGGENAFAIRAKTGAVDIAGMPFEFGDLFTRDIPHPRGVVITGGENAFAIRAKTGAVDIAGMPFEFGDLLPGDVSHPRGVVS
ncbi:MAG: hypothetical protein V7K48_08510 [Nostoc sp.]|uniref:hypothetical protein n=1 Tax=Nostoc sp. TaxID=1180 RepID=UPI002FFA2C5E